MGILAKLYSGGGEGIDHSRVGASQGLGPEGSPLRFDLKKLTMKSSVAGMRRKAPMVDIMLKESHPWPASYV
jgi:hypothetical protein